MHSDTQLWAYLSSCGQNKFEHPDHILSICGYDSLWLTLGRDSKKVTILLRKKKKKQTNWNRIVLNIIISVKLKKKKRFRWCKFSICIWHYVRMYKLLQNSHQKVVIQLSTFETFSRKKLKSAANSTVVFMTNLIFQTYVAAVILNKSWVFCFWNCDNAVLNVVYPCWFTYLEIDDFSNFFRVPNKIKNQINGLMPGACAQNRYYSQTKYWLFRFS